MNSTDKQKTGQIGEGLACKYLTENRYKIIERNYRKPWGEIDIIAKDPNKTLVFVEVKTVRPHSPLRPEDQLTRAKLKKLSRTASIYANNRPELIKNKTGWQIDLIAITLKGDHPDISHYKNIAI